jgi:peptide/nickel transport system ATP-binding protein
MTLTGVSTPAPDAGAGAPLIEVEDLRIQLRSGSGLVTVVDGVSFSVDTSQAVALVGESGAGKSITIRAILGLLNPRKFAVSGTVAIDGVDLSSLSAKAARRIVTNTASLVFQDPTRSLNPTMRVGWQIAEALHRSPSRTVQVSKSDSKERALELMRDVGIADPEARFFAYPHQLSGGMRQRIAIAIALSCRPRIIFLDEPTTSLDVTTQAQIMDLLDDLRSEFAISTVLVTHDLAMAASRVSNVMVMYAGRIVERLPSEEIAREAQMPYSRALLNAVPGTKIGGRMPQPIPGTPPDPRHLPTGCPFNPRCSYAQDRCRVEIPPLEPIDDQHSCACWFPVRPSDPK